MDTSNSNWLNRAGEFADKRITNPEQFQGLALLAIAEAIHRLAAAVETGNAQRPRT
jgi:hypothetical protein